MTTNNETTEDGVSSTAGAGGAINLSSRPSSVPETVTNQAGSGNSATHTPNIVEADSQEEQVVSFFSSGKSLLSCEFLSNYCVIHSFTEKII